MLCKLSTCQIPQRLELQLARVIYTAESESSISTMVFNPSGELQMDFPVRFAVDPPSVAVITQARGLRCTKTGDAMVRAHAGAVSQAMPISCRLVDR